MVLEKKSRGSVFQLKEFLSPQGQLVVKTLDQNLNKGLSYYDEEISQRFLLAYPPSDEFEKVNTHEYRHQILKERLDQLKDLSFQDLSKKITKGNSTVEDVLGFSSEKERLDEIAEIVMTLDGLPAQVFEAKPFTVRYGLIKSLDALYKTFTSMRTFSEKPENKKLVGDGEEGLRKLRPDRITILQDLNYYHYQLLHYFQSINTYTAFSKRFAEQDAQIKELQNALASKELDSFSSLFKTEAKDLLEPAKWWLRTTIVAGALPAAVIFVMLWNGLLVNTFHWAPTIFISGAFSALAVWSARNYAINKNNHLIFKQKALALETFRELAAAAGTDKELREHIYKQASSIIFGVMNTGYLSAKAGKPNDLPNFIQIIGDAVNKEKS